MGDVSTRMCECETTQDLDTTVFFPLETVALAQVKRLISIYLKFRQQSEHVISYSHYSGVSNVPITPYTTSSPCSTSYVTFSHRIDLYIEIYGRGCIFQYIYLLHIEMLYFSIIVYVGEVRVPPSPSHGLLL